MKVYIVLESKYHFAKWDFYEEAIEQVFDNEEDACQIAFELYFEILYHNENLDKDEEKIIKDLKEIDTYKYKLEYLDRWAIFNLPEESYDFEPTTFKVVEYDVSTEITESMRENLDTEVKTLLK